MELFGTEFLASQLTWVAVAFAMLFLVMLKFVVPAVNGVLDARATQIREDLDAAAQLKQEAEHALSSYEKQIKTARQEASNIVAAAKRDAESIATSRIAEVQEEISRKQANAESAIEQAKTKALADVQSQVADMTMLAVEKVLNETVDNKVASKMADEAIKEMLN